MREIQVAIAIIHRGGKILICQRLQGDTFANLWEFPGGKAEPGETPKQCLTREIREELGVGVVVGAPLPTVTHEYPHCAVKLFPYICSLASGEPAPLASQQLKWILPRELPAYSFPPANEGLIRDVIAMIGQ